MSARDREAVLLDAYRENRELVAQLLKPAVNPWVEAVREFARGCDIPIRTELTIPPADEIELRLALVKEETKELTDALELLEAFTRMGGGRTEQKRQLMIEIADGIADSIVVLIGLSDSFGIPLDRVMQEVCRSNNSKCIDNLRDGNGKVRKGKSFSPANIRGILFPEPPR